MCHYNDSLSIDQLELKIFRIYQIVCFLKHPPGHWSSLFLYNDEMWMNQSLKEPRESAFWGEKQVFKTKPITLPYAFNFSGIAYGEQGIS